MIFDKLKKVINNFLMKIGIVKTRYAIKQGKEIISIHKYKKDAKKKVAQLKKQAQVQTIKNLNKGLNPVNIVFPTKWKTSRGGNRIALTPKILIPWNKEPLLDNQGFWLAVGSYLESIDFSPEGFMTKYGWKKGNHPYLERDLKETDKTIEEVRAFVKKYKVKGKWISRGQICKVAKCHPERVKVTHISEKSEYYMSYSEAVKEVERLKK